LRRLGGLFPEIVSVRNLWRGWRDFRQGKRRRPSVREFEVDAQRQVFRLRRALIRGTYTPGEFRLVGIQEPKRRLISAAPVRDRVVHHAVHRVLAPRLDRSLIDTTFACLPGRGSHRAIVHFLSALRRFRHVLLLDIRHYFLSIDREILLELMGRQIKDQDLLRLLARIAESGDGIYQRPRVAEFLGLPPGFPPPGCGLPIGNLTSQWWGNHYLSGVDHFIKRELKIPAYQRYMDDLALFADSASRLEEARGQIQEWLREHRHLRLKRPNAAVRRTTAPFTYLGYRVTQAGIRPTSKFLQRMQARVMELVLQGDIDKLERSVASCRGLLTFPTGL